MAIPFEDDPVGAVLEFAVLHRAHPPRATERSAWEAHNVRKAIGSFGTTRTLWIGPAVTRTLLEDALAAGRNMHDVRRTLERVFRTLEDKNLIEPLPSDDNPSTKYRVATMVGQELVVRDAHREYIHGLSYVVRRWADSVVCLETNGGIGTGFFISPRRVATARHVIDQNGRPKLKHSSGGEIAGEIVRVLTPRDDSSSLDVAILELATDVPNILPMRFAKDRSLLDEVVVFGFPPLLSAKHSQLMVNRGEISAEPILDDGQQVILVTCLLRGGYSGGPALNRCGEVIGLVSKNLYDKVAPDERDINSRLGAAALVPYEWIRDVNDGTV